MSRYRSDFDYYAYIRSPKWRAKADLAKARAEWRCQLCYSTGPLEAHHRTYERLGNELPSDITVLCSECHKRHHGKLPQLPVQIEPQDVSTLNAVAYVAPIAPKVIIPAHPDFVLIPKADAVTRRGTVSRLSMAILVTLILLGVLWLIYFYPVGVSNAQVDCLIKGTVSYYTGGKIYYVPGQKYYSQVQVNIENGDRWLCSETEAMLAGWRKARE